MLCVSSLLDCLESCADTTPAWISGNAVVDEVGVTDGNTVVVGMLGSFQVDHVHTG